MDLNIAWFLLIAILWTGYLVLEGFDFGVGLLLPVFGNAKKFGVHRASQRRRVLINSIGPIWDGNEVWLLTAAGATFAAFPEWYATMFSGFYLIMFVILVGLIVRVCSFEWRAKINSENWRTWCDRGIAFGSFIPAVLWGITFGNLVAGVPIDADKQFTGNLFTLLNPYALFTGLTLLAIFMLHGAIFIALKTDGEVRDDAGVLAARFALPITVIAAVWALWTQLAFGKPWTWAVVIVAAAMLAVAIVTTRARQEKGAFAATSVLIAAAVVMLFGALFPNVMPSTTDPANNLTIYTAASTPYTLKVMTVVAAVFTPIVLLYQSYSYWVFRKRLHVDQMGEHHGLSFDKSSAGHH